MFNSAVNYLAYVGGDGGWHTYEAKAWSSKTRNTKTSEPRYPRLEDWQDYATCSAIWQRNPMRKTAK
jgi:hypothetical protein